LATQNESINVIIKGDSKPLDAEMKRASYRMKVFKKQIASVAGSLGLMFGGAMVIQGVGKAIRSIADFEAQMDKVAAISGATGTKIKALNDNALNLGRTTRFTAIEIGGMQEVLARLGKTSSEIINVTKAVSDLSIATRTDLAPAAELMTKTLNAFGLTTFESARVANILAEATAKTALDMEGLGVGMSYASSAGKAFGWQVEQVAAALGVLTDNGIDSSKAGTGLRRIFIELAKSGMSYDEAMNLINNSTNKLKTSAELFGRTAANQALILAENQEKLKGLKEEFADTNIEMEKMSDIMQDNLDNDLKLLSSAWDGMVMKGGALNNVFRDTVKYLTEIVENLSGEQAMDKRLRAAEKAAKALGTELTNFEKIDIRRGVGAGVKRAEALIFLYNNMLNHKRAEAAEQERITLELKKQKEEQAKINELWAGRYADRSSLGSPGELSGITDGASSVDAVTKSVSNLREQMAGVKMETGLTGSAFNALGFSFVNFSELTAEQSEKIVKAFDDVGKSAIDLGAIIESNITRSIVDLATAMGEGIKDTQEFGRLLLKSIGDFAVSLGEALIAAGTATAIAETTLFTNPWASVAAGAVLVGIGAALGASQKQAMNDLQSGSSTGGRLGDSRMSALELEREQQQIIVGGRLVADGNELVAVLDGTNKANGRIGGTTFG